MEKEDKVVLQPIDRLLCALSVAFAALGWPLVVVKVIMLFASIWGD